MFEQILEQGREFKYILGEVGFCHGDAIKEMSNKFFPKSKIEIRQDLSGLDRNFIIRFGK